MMSEGDSARHPARTMLEQRIKERRQTFEEFVEYVEKFARDHGEPGTLSLRHLQRLVAGRRPDGRPLGPVRPATARLLEHIFAVSVDELLSPPATDSDDLSAIELRQHINASRRVDAEVIALLYEQLHAARRLDRQLGAVVAHEEVRTKTIQVTRLLSHSLAAGIREQLAGLLSELHTLAGWQALDIGKITTSWQHYECAKTAALQSGSIPFNAHAAAEQAFVLLDIGDITAAVDLLATTRETADRKCSPLLRSWLAASHGEALAANALRSESLRAFDTAEHLLPTDPTSDSGPYVALDATHLARWRGHALARFGDPAAVDVLTGALDRLDPSFTRAEAALRVDLAAALASIGEGGEARAQCERAASLANAIGSARQRRRLGTLATRLK